MEDFKLAVIMRGLPGSGKSTAAAKLKPLGARIHSTDTYRVDAGGNYSFESAKESNRHAANLLAFTADAEAGHPVLVCDNVNALRSHFAPYVAAAEANGYVVSFLEMDHPPPKVAAQRNSHGVTVEIISTLIARWEPINAAEAEVQFDDPVEQAAEFLVEGNSLPSIKDYLAHHGVTDSASIIQLALERLGNRVSLTEAARRSWCVEAFREVFRRMLKIGDYPGATRAIQEIGKLTGCYARAKKATAVPEEDQDNSVLALRVI